MRRSTWPYQVRQDLRSIHRVEAIFLNRLVDSIYYLVNGLEELITARRQGSKSGQNESHPFVDFRCQLNLMIFLFSVLLIDAKSIDPKRAHDWSCASSSYES
jgi:hypothetical protein